MKNIILVAVGGSVGSVLRYMTSLFVAKYYSHAFPLATFITNLLGCFIIGIAVGFFSKLQPNSESLKLLLVTGFCGGYTTFSAFGYENVMLFQNNGSALAFAYIAASIVGGILSVCLGLFLMAAR